MTKYLQNRQNMKVVDLIVFLLNMGRKSMNQFHDASI